MLDILIKRSRAVTLEGGLRMGNNIDITLKENADVAIKDGKILRVAKDINDKSRRVIDASGNVVIPGFIDVHTHALFGGSRIDEFELKIRGLSYEEIMKRGGGIVSTVEKTRTLSLEDMMGILDLNLGRMSDTGTTTVEVKSGYGLDFNTEISMLKAMNGYSSECIDIIPTYMGAHEFPKEKTKEDYISDIIEEHLPAVKEESLSEFCDIFCETGVFEREESRRILKRAKGLDMMIKVHADELMESGGAELAGELGAISAEHLIHPSEKGLELMSSSGVIATMLPATSFIISQDVPPIEDFRENGIPMALGSDFNPGSSPVTSMPLVIGLACYYYGMTVEESIAGATINAAYAVKRENSLGSIEEGKMADLLILDYKDYREIPYWLGNNPVKTLIKAGRICFER